MTIKAPKAQPVLVIGGGGHAKVILHVLERLPQFKVLGYVDPRNGGPLLGYPRLGGDDSLPVLAEKSGIAAVIGIGKVASGGERLKMLADLRALGFALPAVVAPTAQVAKEVVLGEGTVVMDGAIIQPGCVVGKASIINTRAVLDHDCVLGDDVHIGPSATLSGHVSVGEGGMVGVGVSVMQGLRIVSQCTIGAGAAVTEDCMEAGTYVGVPARRKLP